MSGAGFLQCGGDHTAMAVQPFVKRKVEHGFLMPLFEKSHFLSNMKKKGCCFGQPCSGSWSSVKLLAISAILPSPVT